ncbi:TetR/AcrR family transcriptional regulator [Nocardioides jishulii]|uniref:TetR/AcrR family transcriptional regulator n=2 Tax=Nocardioides jishulii TaxID=2575440 RepID=A0A4U2YR01_9ACTN|nr:TetR/AcrR family transcriptional regulator [Nocardioides jishulii]
MVDATAGCGAGATTRGGRRGTRTARPRPLGTDRTTPAGPAARRRTTGSPMSSDETKVALMDAAVRVTATTGTKGLTARGIAAEAGVNAALVHYHFGGVEGLLHQAYERATLTMIGDYTADLTSVSSFEELYRVGATMAEKARSDGSAAMLSAIIAAAHTNEAMAQMLGDNMVRWNEAVSTAVERILTLRKLNGAIDVESLTASLTASTIGMMTLGSVPGQPLGDPIVAVSGLPPLLDRAMKLVPAPLARKIFGAIS